VSRRKSNTTDKTTAGEFIVKSIYVPRDKVTIWERLKKSADTSDRSVSETVLIAIEKFLGSNEPSKD